MPQITGFSDLESLPVETINDKIKRRILSGEKGMIVWWSIKAEVMRPRIDTRTSRSSTC